MQRRAIWFTETFPSRANGPWNAFRPTTGVAFGTIM